MTKEKCGNMASVRRYWPGNDPDLVCVEHAEDSKRVAAAMGFRLILEPIAYSTSDALPDEFPTCCCNAGFSQSINVKSSAT